MDCPLFDFVKTIQPTTLCHVCVSCRVLMSGTKEAGPTFHPAQH